MKDIIDIFSTQLPVIAIGLCAYGFSQVADIAFGVGLAKQEKEFDWKKFWKGVFKGIIVALGCITLTLSIDFLTVLIDYGITIEGIESISFITMIGLFGYATFNKTKDAIAKLKEILGV